MYVRFSPDGSIIARLFVMGGTNAQLLIGQQVSLPGHFALPVALEAAHPVPQGYECQVRLPDGTLKQITISLEEAAALAPQPEKAKPHSRPSHRPGLQLQPEIPLGLPLLRGEAL